MKKLILTALALLISVGVNTGVYASDISGHENESAMKFLSGIGIMEGYDDGSYRPDNNITRAEFAALSLRMSALGDVAQGYTSSSVVFKDIPENAWYRPYAYMASDMGYMVGYGDNIFGGEDLLTNNQAIKTVVCILGYEDIALANGGYPAGYVNVASTLDILDGVPVNEENATRANVAQLIANSLNARMADKEYGATGSAVAYGDEALLDKLNLVRYEGVIESAGGISSVSSDQSVAENEIIISGKKYENAYGDALEYFGIKVEYYVDKNSKESMPKVYYIAPAGAFNTITVESENIRTSTTLDTFEYYYNEKAKKAKLENAEIIYNGKRLNTADMTPDKLRPQDGRVILLDADDNGKYEIAIVWEYRNMIVKSVYDGTVYGEYSTSAKLNLDEDDCVTAIFYNSERVDCDVIKQGDVLSVFESKDGKFKRIIISRQEERGTVTKISSSPLSVELDNGRKLVYSNSYIQLINGSYVNEPAFGVSSQFRLDAYGRIALCEEEMTSNAKQYGYITDIYVLDGEEGIIIKYLDQNNTFCKATVDKCKVGYVNGSLYTVKRLTATEIYNLLYDEENNTTNTQLMKYTVEDGMMKELYLVDTTDRSGIWGDRNQTSSERSTYSGGLFAGEEIISPNTIVFDMRLNAQTGLLDRETMRSGKASALLANGNAYRCLLYDIKNEAVGCVVIATQSSLSGGFSNVIDITNDNMMLITDVREGISEDGDTRTVLEGFINAEPGEVVVHDVLEPNSTDRSYLKPGMLIQYKENTEDRKYAETADIPIEMILFSVVADLSGDAVHEVLWNKMPDWMANASLKTVCGNISFIDLPNCLVDVNGKVQTMVMSDYTRVVEYDRMNNIAKEVPVDTLQEGMEVYVRQRYNVVREVYILK